MAIPIKDTPILYGKDAETFLKNIQNPKPVSKSERDRIKQSFIAIDAIKKE
jgi:hypothetical protein